MANSPFLFFPLLLHIDLELVNCRGNAINAVCSILTRGTEHFWGVPELAMGIICMEPNKNM
ncbi:MAG: hypothetical protein JL50_05715 [Peptococcaceae bacterium BICA1-7]|nr:MAG: hypothetical protein JL50_05715 [Peptococcaceae bacterium BICA1-7]HBV96107.1 hypothetical protein [Desulfotomaculum sp.]